MATLPVVGLSSNPTMFSKVDFPQPEGPMTLTNSPFSMLMLTFSRAVVSISCVRYTLFTPSSLIILIILRFYYYLPVLNDSSLVTLYPVLSHLSPNPPPSLICHSLPASTLLHPRVNDGHFRLS